MGFYFDGSGQRTHRHGNEELEREDVEPARPSPGKSSRTHGGGGVRGIPGKVSLTARLAQRIDRFARSGRNATPDEYAREMVAQALESAGRPLPDALRRSLEEHADLSLSDVRIHTGPDSARAAEALDAEAFTVGRDIHFGAGKYDPDSADGRRLLAHEVAHTFQQRRLPEVELEEAAISQSNQGHERRADEFAGLFARSESEPSGQKGTVSDRSPTQASVASARTARPALALAKREPGETATPPLNALEFSNGQPLPDALVRAAEALLGTPLSGVEIHTGDSADEAAAAIGARAFTIGPHIFFRNGRYAPHTASGRALLLHELAHVVQWIRGDVPAGSNPTLAQASDPLEQEADSLTTRLALRFSPAEPTASVGMPSPVGFDAGLAPRAPGRGAHHQGMTGLVLREVEGDGSGTVAAPTEVPAGGVPVNRPGIVNWDGDTKLRLRASASTTEDNIIGELEFNCRVQVIKKFPGDWLFVATEGGQLGYVASAYVWTNLPEPNAKLHRVEGGVAGTAIAIAEQYYGDHVDDWGQDLRFYVNVLAWANKKEVPNSTSGWKKVHFQANDLIWIPSQPFARSLKGVINSGSYSYNAADFLGVADLVERIGQLWDDFARAISLAGQYIPEALARHSLEGLQRGLQALIDMLLIAGLVMILATALGAAIGALAGGVGAAPGAAAGFKVGLAVLKWLGLAFLVAWVGDALIQIGSAFGSFIGTVWGADGDEASLDQAARELAEALGLMVGKIIEGLVMLAAAKGIGFVIGKLGGTRFGQKLGSRFNEWLSRETKGKGETGKGETNKSEAGKGETGKSETAKGEVSKSETGKGETNKSEAARGETNKSETGKNETGKGETNKSETTEKTTTSEATKQHVHEGSTVNDPQSPYHGKWDGKGIHSWEGLKARVAKDGYKILEVKEDPTTGIRRVTIQRIGKDPKTGAEVKGTIKKTIYPREMTPAEINAAGEAALAKAEAGEPGTKFDPYGTATKSDGTPADGYFEADVTTPAGNIRVQGWFKETASGKEISSHAPRFEKTWPTIKPEDY